MGGSKTRGTGISPHDAFNVGDVDACVDSNKEENEDYSPTPAYKLPRTTQNTKTWDPKVDLDSNYFTFLCPLPFDTKSMMLT